MRQPYELERLRIGNLGIDSIPRVGIVFSHPLEYRMMQAAISRLQQPIIALALPPPTDEWVLSSNFPDAKAFRLNQLNSVIEIIEKVDISKVISNSESTLIDAALLNEHLGFPGQSIDSAIALRDKLKTRQHLHKAGVPIPDFCSASDSNAREFMDGSSKILLKPRLGSASRGIEFWSDRYEIGQINQNHYMLEQYIEGRLFHADGLIIDGQVVFIAPSEYITPPLDYRLGRPGGSRVLLSDDRYFAAINDFSRNALQAVPMPHTGAFHMDIFLSNEGRLLAGEITSRTAGNRIREMLLRSYGVDIVTETLLALTNLRRSKRRPPFPDTPIRPAGWGSVRIRSGYLVGAPAFHDIPVGTSQYILHPNPGALIPDATGAVDSLLSFVVEGSARSEILERHSAGIAWCEQKLSDLFIPVVPSTTASCLCLDHKEYNIFVGSPGELELAYIMGLEELIREGDAAETILASVRSALHVVIVCDNRKVIGCGVIKRPRPNCASTVSKLCNLAFDVQTAELGAVVVGPEYRGRGLCGKIVSELLNSFKGALWCTTSDDRMKYTLVRRGFIQKGDSWQGRAGKLTLWLLPQRDHSATAS